MREPPYLPSMRSGQEATFMSLPRRKLTSVIWNARAVSIAREVGPEMAQTIGMPATAAFCRIFERGSTRHHEDGVVGAQAVHGGPPDHLVDGVVPADILAAHAQAAVGVEEARGVQRAGTAEAFLRASRRSGSDSRTARRTRRRDVTGAAWMARASRDALPHRPQAALAMRLRRSLW